MYDFELTIGEPIVFLEIAPTKELTRAGARFSLASQGGLPAGLTITPGGPDPTLSLGAPSGEEGRIGNPSYNSGVGRIANPSYSGIVSVPVLLDNPHPEGSTGMTEAIFA